MREATNRIRELRRAKGWTATQLADRVGTSNVQISRLETGDRKLTVDWMERLADVLGCRPADIMEAPTVPELVTDLAPPPPDLQSLADALSQRDICLHTLATDAVAGSGLGKGAHVSIDCGPQACGLIKDGDIVCVDVGGTLLLRHFIGPRILITNNERAPNVLLLDDPALDARIIGVVVR